MSSISTFTSTPAYPTSTPTCSVSAWMSPGHAFVDFNCGEEMRRTVGFYPGLGVCDDSQTRPIIDRALGTFATGMGLDATAIGQSSSSRVYSSKVGYGKTSSISSSSIPSQYPSINMPGSSSIFSGASLSHGFGSIQIVDLATGAGLRGEFEDDSLLLEKCLKREIPCMVKHFNVSNEVASKAWKSMLSIREEINLDWQRKCPLQTTGKFKFSLLKHNCVDFMRTIMKSVGDLNHRIGFQYYSSPSRMDKLTAVAWHYFNWT